MSGSLYLYYQNAGEEWFEHQLTSEISWGMRNFMWVSAGELKYVQRKKEG